MSTPAPIKLVDALGNEVGTHKITEEIKPEERSPAQLAAPSGYHILIALPEVKSEYDSGIIKADKTIASEQVSSVIGFALKLGPDCYNDKAKFPTGPWCKQGDFVLIGAYKGTRIKIHGQEFRIINDDDVLGVTDDPRGYTRF